MTHMAIFDGTSSYVIESIDFDPSEMENLGESDSFDEACFLCDEYDESE